MRLMVAYLQCLGGVYVFSGRKNSLANGALASPPNVVGFLLMSGVDDLGRPTTVNTNHDYILSLRYCFSKWKTYV